MIARSIISRKARIADGRRVIALTGISGAGKSVIGKALAKRLGVSFVDLDEEISNREGKPISAIFSSQGENRFREMETAALREALQRKGPRVVALGGGALMSKVNRELLDRFARLVYLRVSCSVAAERLLSSTDRPLLTGADCRPLSRAMLTKRLREMLSRRKRFYEHADVSVRVTGRREIDIVSEVKERLKALDPENAKHR